MLASLPSLALADGTAPSSTLQTFFLIVMIMAAGYLFLRSQRYFARQRNDASTAAPAAPPPPERQYTAVPEDLTRWEVEMHDTARQLSGQLDSKLAALGHLVREADRAAARLEAALSATRPANLECGGLPPLSVPPEAGGSPASDGESCGDGLKPALHPGAAGGLSGNDGRPDEPPGNQARALQAPGATEEPAEPPTAGSPSAAPHLPADRRYEEIYLLADYGFDPAEIGRRVNMPVGEIQLILSLRAKR
jgi:hypothetical protein